MVGKLFCIFILLIALLAGDEYSNRIYSEIHDLYHPTTEELGLIQNYLETGCRPLIGRLDEWQYQGKARHFRILGRDASEQIESGIIPVNCDLDDKERCILLYCSFNFSFPEALKRLIERIKESDFVGHILYRIGGWPNMEGGDLVLAHIPFAFKICFFREAESLGYRSALWLDTAVVPLKGLKDAFQKIDQKGYYTYVTNFSLQDYCNPQACAAMGVSFDEAARIPLYVAGIIGFDFENSLARQALSKWHRITVYNEEAYYNHRQELSIISAILHQSGMRDCEFYKDKLTWDRNDVGNPAYDFLIDKLAVQPNWPN